MQGGITLKLGILGLLIGLAAAYGQVSIGIHIGPPPPPRVVRVLPARPGPEFVWVDGYWYPVGSRYTWHGGYWTRPAFPGARWVAPRHDGARFYQGYWEGEREREEHNHGWDRGRDRDFHDHEHHDNGKHKGWERGKGHDK
jgi:hypothetical protein